MGKDRKDFSRGSKSVEISPSKNYENNLFCNKFNGKMSNRNPRGMAPFPPLPACCSDSQMDLSV